MKRQTLEKNDSTDPRWWELAQRANSDRDSSSLFQGQLRTRTNGSDREFTVQFSFVADGDDSSGWTTSTDAERREPTFRMYADGTGIVHLFYRQPTDTERETFTYAHEGWDTVWKRREPTAADDRKRSGDEPACRRVATTRSTTDRPLVTDGGTTQGLNADTLDGLDGSQFMRSDRDTRTTGALVSKSYSNGVGSATITQDTNGALELGRSTTSNATPYIDFNAGVGKNQDYNVRLINDANRRLQINGAGGAVNVNVNGTLRADSVSSDGAKVLTEANEGAGNGLDADTVDGHNVFVSASEPSNPNQGDLWVDTSGL